MYSRRESREMFRIFELLLETVTIHSSEFEIQCHISEIKTQCHSSEIKI